MIPDECLEPDLKLRYDKMNLLRYGETRTSSKLSITSNNDKKTMKMEK